jgi:cell division protein FtsA
MAKLKTIAAIELGSSKIKTLIAQVSEDEQTLEKIISITGVSSVDSHGIKKGQIVDIEEVVESAIESVESAERMAGGNLDAALVALGGASIGSQNSHGVVAVSDPNSEIKPSDVERVVDAAKAVSLPTSREVLHVLPREFVVDGESGVKDPIGMSGVRLEVNTHMVTSSIASIKNIKKALNEIGVKVDELIYSGLASSEAVLTKTEKELGCVLVDLGGGTTSIATYIDGSLSYSSVLPVGAKNVTNDLAIGLQVSLESAEKIKLILSKEFKKKPKAFKDIRAGSEDDTIDLSEYGFTDTKKVSRKTLLEGIIKPRLNEIFTMVRLQLEKEGIRNKVPSGVIITGGGAETAGVEESARKSLSLPVRIGKPKGVTGLIDDVIKPEFSTTVGLLLMGAKSLNYGKSLTSLPKKIKLPSKGMLTKTLAFIKELLP